MTRYAFWPIIAGLLLAFLILERMPPREAVVTASPAQIPLIESSNAATAPGSGPVSYADGTEQAAPSVVNIYTARIIRQRVHPLLMDPFFRQFFGYQEMPRERRMQSSLGSGVIASTDGFVLTNHHVIQGADEIQVALRDGRETQAKLVGSDPETDLALLKIDLPDLPAIQVRDATEMRVGDVVLAIGNPFGVGQTVTMGIISATGRSQLGINTFENFIQTDAAINPGNSGGALVDARGRLIGINTAIFSKSGGSMGIGFAIPSNLAWDVMQDLINHGEVVRGWLGIEIQEMTRELAASFGMPDHSGILIAGMFRDGPAHRAGLRPGDVLIAINSKKISDGKHAMEMISRIKPGKTAQLQIRRDGKQFAIEATMGRRQPASRGR